MFDLKLIKKYSALIAEDGNDKDDESNSDKDADEDYDYTPEEKERRNKKRRVKNALTATGDRGMFPDPLAGTGIDRSKGSNFGDPYGMKTLGRDLGKSGLLDPNPLSEAEESYDIDEASFLDNFFNEKSQYQAKMTSDLRSTLKSLKSRINSSNSRILGEANVEDEDLG